MYFNSYLPYAYFFAIASLVIFVFTGLLINNKQRRAVELKAIIQSFLVVPMVLQGVWLVILLAHMILHIPFYFMNWLDASNGHLPFDLAFSLVNGLMLLGANLLLWRQAQHTPHLFTRQCLQAVCFIAGCFLLANQVLNYFWHGWGQQALVPWINYDNAIMAGVLLLTSLMVWLLVPQWRKRKVQTKR